MTTQPEACYRCGSPVSIEISASGARGEHGWYHVACPTCGRVVDNLPSSAKDARRGAVREWNRIARGMQIKRGSSNG